MQKIYLGDEPISRVYHQGELTYPNPVKDGLVLWYDFMGRQNSDVRRDVAVDLSGNGNDGELVNFAYQEGSGYERGVALDGVDDYIRAGAISSINKSMTAEIAFLTNSKGGVLGSSGYYSYLIQISSGSQFRIRLWDTDKVGTDFYVNSLDLYGKKKHFAFTYDGTNVAIYLDGALVNSESYTQTLSDHSSTLIGRYEGGGAVHAKGATYSTRIYNRALTEAEIQHNYQMEKERWNL